MNDELSLEERVLRSIMEPSQPLMVMRRQGIKQETPKAAEVPPAIPRHPGLKVVAKGQQGMMKEKWVNGWRTLADLTSGIQQSDHRFNPLINLLEQADTAFERDNWEEFQSVASRVRNIAQKGS